jgi:hypothetical protein
MSAGLGIALIRYDHHRPVDTLTSADRDAPAKAR